MEATTSLTDMQRRAVCDLFETCELIRELYAKIVLYGQTHNEAVLESDQTSMQELMEALQADIDFAENQDIAEVRIVAILEDRLPNIVLQQVMGT